ncbi:GntR family transcriptional regulator [Streptomyces sp. 8L]|uniref:GntR family transcriptional regulator n=1 Tax=Streptomyces sp. 8L TaxID=2877242 RepID=UPI001CD5E1B2|nr:GntR family transcriptional regulator [Streptomyces sp. 8L]MCA1220748.1 GntR family transcriptional regulator [Streptomyces sp. 8L]
MTTSEGDGRSTVPIARNQPLREAVYARIVSLLSTGRLAPGMSVTEAALSRSLDVSRTPVREALLRLEAEGVVRSALARGFVVRPLSTREVREVYPILAALEALALRSVTRPLEEAEHERLAATLDALESAGDAVARRALDTEFHSALAGLCGNEHLKEAIARLRTSLSRYEIAYMECTPVRGPADRQHRRVLSALAAGDTQDAAAVVEEHWLDGMRGVADWLSSAKPAPPGATGAAAGPVPVPGAAAVPFSDPGPGAAMDAGPGAGQGPARLQRPENEPS